MSLTGLVNLSAETYEIIYSIDYNDGWPRRRSVAKKLFHIYQNKENLLISSICEYYAHVIITDKNGIVIKEETITIIPGQDTLLYIGDLAAGTYELTIETESYTLHGGFEVE